MSKPINLIFAIAFIWLALIPLACSQPPVTTVQYFPDGYTTIGSQQEYLKQGQDYQYNFFVENASDGALITNETINCTFYMADSTGEVKIFSDVPYFPDGHWGIDIDGANFSDVGIYCYGVRCSNGFGGHTTGCWEVTYDGKDLPGTNLIIVYSIMFMFIICLGIYFFIKSLERVLDLEMDIKDLTIIISSYIFLWFFYFFVNEYLANPVMLDMLEIAMDVGAITHVFLPIVGFMVSYILTHLQLKKKAAVTY
jgi:hypothetical protein